MSLFKYEIIRKREIVTSFSFTINTLLQEGFPYNLTNFNLCHFKLPSQDPFETVQKYSSRNCVLGKTVFLLKNSKVKMIISICYFSSHFVFFILFICIELKNTLFPETCVIVRTHAGT